MRWRAARCVLMIALANVYLHANPCDLTNLPESIRSSLRTTYSGWKVVTPAMLEISDRETWSQRYSKECPGMIKGRFAGDSDGFVLNLVMKEGGKLFQQIVYFRPDEASFSPLEVFPRMAIGVQTVIRKFAPGQYKSAHGGRSILIKTDTVGVSQIEAWTEVYYWDKVGFRSIITSE